MGTSHGHFETEVQNSPSHAIPFSETLFAHRVDWWRPLQWPSSNMADVHRFGTESPPLTAKYGVYASDIWRVCSSTHWTLRIQITERNVMSTTRNEPSKCGPDEDHSIPGWRPLEGHSVAWWRPLAKMKATLHLKSLNIFSQSKEIVAL